MTKEDKETYEKFFKSALKKFGVDSPAKTTSNLMKRRRSSLITLTRTTRVKTKSLKKSKKKLLQ